MTTTRGPIKDRGTVATKGSRLSGALVALSKKDRYPLKKVLREPQNAALSPVLGAVIRIGDSLRGNETLD